ncbi:M48 family metallopeptidase [Romboutsia sp. 13368]|uniref:M48 family metallopeptidase n=1 Tax=Romboutsia sp. 13368 TaxID=2708053 RepID=UPI0025EC6EF7|nr:SprT family zinc-dependent metalloprotease [Romboutsia sp. 13368]
MYKINFENTIINYSINKKSNVKNITIKVKHPNIVTVVSPKSVNDEFIHDLVVSKSKWILNKINEFKNKESENPPILLVDGDKIPYLGNYYVLNVSKEKDIIKCSLTFNEDKFVAKVPYNISSNEQYIKLRELLINWYLTEGSKLIKERLTIYSKKLNLYPYSITLKEQKTSWGTCSSKGNIYINWKVLLAPLDIIDYVLVHELCHLKYMNHSKEYWSLVSTIFPDYKEKRNYLKENSLKLNI